MDGPLGHWIEEKRSAFLYRSLSESEGPGAARDLFAKLAREADAQAQRWADIATREGASVPAAYAPDLRARVVARLAAALGARRVRGVLAASKVRGLSALDAAPVGHPLPGKVEDVGRRHRGAASAGNLRAAVFGASDGLVSNASLVLGVAGAASDPHVVLLSGVAGLLAGAFSMASGEWVSVRSQREMVERQLATEKEEIEQYPEAEAAELALVYEARGLPQADAESLATRLVSDPERALQTLAREELGVDPGELVSPWGAAIFSFVAFAIGAVLPLLPFLVAPGPWALPASVVVTALALFALGALTSLFTGASAVKSGLRQLFVGAIAGATTHLAGRLLGATGAL